MTRSARAGACTTAHTWRVWSVTCRTRALQCNTLLQNHCEQNDSRLCRHRFSIPKQEDRVMDVRTRLLLGITAVRHPQGYQMGLHPTCDIFFKVNPAGLVEARLRPFASCRAPPPRTLGSERGRPDIYIWIQDWQRFNLDGRHHLEGETPLMAQKVSSRVGYRHFWSVRLFQSTILDRIHFSRRL